MSGELARLRADLEAINRVENIMAPFSYEYGKEFYDKREKIRDEIARLEAEQADPWREHRASVEFMRKTVYAAADVPKVVAYVDHLTAERDRLAARVAELEAAQADDFKDTSPPKFEIAAKRTVKYTETEPLKPRDVSAEFDDVDDDPILDPKRIAATMARIAKGWRPNDHQLIEELEFLAATNEGDSAKPYRLKGASE